ncbi:MAG: hypothetical protein E7191_02725 [Erysipelotrichaceae bacterium]|nr:hypothetical protein [Erysipelotrichaceae bacterium]
MLRKFIVLLLCMMLSGCTQQQGNGENTTVSTISTISNKRQDTIEERTNAFFDKKYNTLIQNYTNSPYSSHIAVNINYPNDILHMYMTSENDENDIQYLLHYDIIDHTHEVDIYNYHFYYLTQGNIRCIKATFHIEFTEFYDDFIYDIFNITILTQDNVELKVKYDMKKQEFYDASEGALENDVMNFNKGMKDSLLLHCISLIHSLRKQYAIIEAYTVEYEKYITHKDNIMEDAFNLSINLPSINLYIPKKEIKTSALLNEQQFRFRVNFDYKNSGSLRDVQYILYHIDDTFNDPSEVFDSNEFIAPLLFVTNRYSCIGGYCTDYEDIWMKENFTGDGIYYGIYTITDYKKAVKDVLGIDSTYTLSTGQNNQGYYEDKDIGAFFVRSYAGDGPTIPYGLYVTDSKEENGILTLTYKKYDLEEYIGDQYCPSIDACDHPVSYYEEHYRDIVLTHPTWTATLKYNPEKDLYQILSISKE